MLVKLSEFFEKTLGLSSVRKGLASMTAHHKFYFGGLIYPLDDHQPQVAAVAVADGRILAARRSIKTELDRMEVKIYQNYLITKARNFLFRVFVFSCFRDKKCYQSNKNN